MREKTEGTQPIIDGDQDHVFFWQNSSRRIEVDVQSLYSVHLHESKPSLAVRHRFVRFFLSRYLV